jgi:hypothetical protein
MGGFYGEPQGTTKIVNRAAANTPQTTTTPYFTVSGGKVLVLGIYGEVTTVLGAGENNLKLIANPTTGADVDLCVQLDTDADAAGTMYNITGTVADAMVATTSGAMKGQAIPVVVAVGTIDLYASASKTGQTKWSVHYVPIDSGATVTAA